MWGLFFRFAITIGLMAMAGGMYYVLALVDIPEQNREIAFSFATGMVAILSGSVNWWYSNEARAALAVALGGKKKEDEREVVID